MSEESWTTLDEIKFIEGLGTWSSSRLSHEELLEKYKESIQNRVVWNDGGELQMDKDEIIAYLEGEARVVRGAGPKGRKYVKLGKED